MRSYKEVLRLLIIREQLALGWKIGLFIVCGALLFGSLTLMHVNIRSADVRGTVISHHTDTAGNGTVTYLDVRLESGETVGASSSGPIDYRPGQEAAVREITTNFFGLKKYEFSRYLDTRSGD
jgi:hypothetical protein